MKEIYKYTEKEFENLVKHTPTRWLILNQALEKNNNMNKIKSYFIGIGDNELSRVMILYCINMKLVFQSVNYTFAFLMI